jgi:hypothetical protein
MIMGNAFKGAGRMALTAVTVVVLAVAAPRAGVSLASVATLTAGTATGTWGSAQAVPGLAALSTGVAESASASCPTPGNCTIVGYYAGRVSAEEPFAVSEVDGSWRDAVAIPGASSLEVNGARLSSLSCAAPGNCSAGGGAVSAAGGPRAFVASEVDGVWGRARLVALGSALRSGQSDVRSMSCPLPGDCVAAGFAAGADFGGLPMVVTQAKGTWGAASVLSLPAGFAGPATVTSVSCAAVGYCSAVGTYEDASGNWHAFVATEEKGKWGAGAKVPLGTAPAGETSRQALSSVSCAAPGNCVAGGYAEAGATSQAYLVGQSGGRWGAPFAVKGVSGQVAAVSCAGPGGCAAIGTDVISSVPGGFAVSEAASGRWGDPKTFSGVTLNSVSCAAAGTCSAGGQDSAAAVTLDATAGDWGTPANLKGSAPGEQVVSVSCAAAGACAAAGGGYNQGAGAWQTLLATEKNPVVGIYSDFTATAKVQAAVMDGWPLLASVSGTGKPANCTSAWAVPSHSDGVVEKFLSSRGRPYPQWISFWTPAVPSVGTSLYDDGLATGKLAASDIEQAASKVGPPLNPVMPAYVALDFDTSDIGTRDRPSARSCGTDVPAARLKAGTKRPGDKQCWDWANPKAQANCWNISPVGWKEFAEGWAAGVRSAAPLPLSPAIYGNTSEYLRDRLGLYGLRLADYIPVLLGVAFGGPRATGPAIAGNIAFYGTCSSATDPTAADKDVAMVRSWGALVNTIQFRGSQICLP